ncbi:hypothetical protein N7489_001834 [Penicillium chrysogenum]|uniref:Uncharacterized protein n=1 Tax=Penicillium chrysogenum TaxID=5076 RepID=A0ABQ8WJS7_PENCH|nr:uncharacterized protein N7489_001834 [Penicillium chrysogenum]KAJ5251424.1 hypothetical protein N7489_001834 [Penicillium chrysogenum]KAJ5262856.1 hypothetical protein N7524_008161 [Penicillium chrysogenum]KAJ5270322.1 hypothetical protein N7505_006080 [Penicillium chrysogenum]
MAQASSQAENILDLDDEMTTDSRAGTKQTYTRLKQLILKTLDKFNTGIGQLLDGIRWAINLRAATLTPYHHRLIGEFKISFEKHRQLANPGLN